MSYSTSQVIEDNFVSSWLLYLRIYEYQSECQAEYPIYTDEKDLKLQLSSKHMPLKTHATRGHHRLFMLLLKKGFLLFAKAWG